MNKSMLYANERVMQVHKLCDPPYDPIYDIEDNNDPYIDKLILLLEFLLDENDVSINDQFEVACYQYTLSTLNDFDDVKVKLGNDDRFCDFMKRSFKKHRMFVQYTSSIVEDIYFYFKEL